MERFKKARSHKILIEMIKIRNLGLLTFFVFSSIFISCSEKEEIIEQEQDQNLIDLRTVELSTQGLQPVFEVLESNFKKEFKGELINVSTGIENRQIVNLKSSVDYNNVIHLELMTDGGETLDIYSSPSLENPYETIVFAVNDGIVTDEVRFTFSENSDGTFNFSALRFNDSTKGWLSCMSGVFDDELVGTTITLLGVAGGAGCLPCGIAGATITGFAGIGCLAAI